MQLLKYLDNLPSRALTTIAALLILMIGVLGYLTGNELVVSIFYLLPVVMLAWYIPKPIGLAWAFIAALTWTAMDVIGRMEAYSHPLIPLSNGISRFAIFAIVTWLVITLKVRLAHEQILARTDPLTGAANPRAFYERTAQELARTQRYRHPFSLIYLDADNFKLVNDQWGHSVGEMVLQTIATTVQRHLRLMDVVGRLGGDEFAIMLPMTGLEEARVACERIRRALLNEVQRHQWPVTFSIGLLTCLESPPDIDALIHQADSLMYAVKYSGKNAIKHGVFRQGALQAT